MQHTRTESSKKNTENKQCNDQSHRCLFLIFHISEITFILYTLFIVSYPENTASSKKISF